MNFTPTNTMYHAQSEVVVTGTNPEMADMSNSNGDIFEEAWMVVATNSHGDRRAQRVGLGPEGRAIADRLVVVLTRRLEKLGRLPVMFGLWYECRPEYGSDAYLEYGQAADVALERYDDSGDPGHSFLVGTFSREG